MTNFAIGSPSGLSRRTPKSTLHELGEGLEEEGEHAVAGDIGERGEFEGVVAAGEF